MVTRIAPPAYGAPAYPARVASKDAARGAAESIKVAFPWHCTAEGYDFWKTLTDRLLAIADGEPLE